MQVSLRRARDSQDFVPKAIESQGSSFVSEDGIDYGADPLCDDFRKELQSSTELKAAPASWPRPIAEVLTPEGQALAKLGVEQKQFGAIRVDHLEALVHEQAQSNALVLTAGEYPDLGFATLALSEDGTAVVDFECHPPSAATRWAKALIDAGLLEPGAAADLGARSVDTNGEVEDLDGDGKISPADFDGVLPSDPKAVGKELAKEVVDQKARVVLIGEEHDLSADAETEALAGELIASGKSVVVGYELESESFGPLLERLNEGPLSADEAEAWKGVYLENWRMLAEEKGATISDADLETAVGPRADHLLRMNQLGVEVHAIDGNAYNRDELMAQRLEALADADPDRVVIGLVGMRHASSAGALDPGVATLGADPKSPAGKRLADIYGADRVISTGFAAFGADLAEDPFGFDHLYAKGSW